MFAANHSVPLSLGPGMGEAGSSPTSSPLAAELPAGVPLALPGPKWGGSFQKRGGPWEME